MEIYGWGEEATMRIRRITTAEAPFGVFAETDDVFDTSTVEAGIDVFDIWGFDKVPDLPVRPEHVFGEYKRLGVFGPLDAVRVAIMVIPPVVGEELSDLSESIDKLDLGTGGGMFPGEEGGGMHRTDSIDLIMVLEGETNVAYPGEDGQEYEITIKAGDFLTHNGTFHRWHNRSGSNCTVLIIPIAAERKTE
jgi:hypothetical protein